MWSGRPQPGLPSPELVRRWTSPQRSRTVDLVLGRPCTFGYGFMTDLRDQNFGVSPSAAGFGHAGWMGMSFAFADPDHELVVAMLTNAMPRDAGVGPEFHRRLRISKIYQLLGLLGAREPVR